MVDLRELPPECFEQRNVFRHSLSYLPDIMSLRRSSPLRLINLRGNWFEPTSDRHHAL